MAKARVSTNPMYTGGAGGYSFYVRGGEQVVRQRRNNSNYGESASRTESQMLRRVKWGNLVNVYKAMSSWQPKAYEFKNPGQTDYNIFMSMNINSASCALTKDMANNGCAVQEGFWVSRGSLPPIERAVADPQGGIATNITMTITPSANTTVGQFAADIIANNPQFIANDNIAIIMFTNFQDSRDYPYLTCQYSEVTLDPSSTQLLQSITNGDRIFNSGDNELAFRIGALNSHESGLVMIHTRRVNGALAVSSQRIWGTGETLIDFYAGQNWIQTCILSYGLDQQVPLDPGAGGETASQVNLLTQSVSQDILINSEEGDFSETGSSLVYSAGGLGGRNILIQASAAHTCIVAFVDTYNVEATSQYSDQVSIPTGTSRTIEIPFGTKSIVIRDKVGSYEDSYLPVSAVIL